MLHKLHANSLTKGRRTASAPSLPASVLANAKRNAEDGAKPRSGSGANSIQALLKRQRCRFP